MLVIPPPTPRSRDLGGAEMLDRIGWLALLACSQGGLQQMVGVEVTTRLVPFQRAAGLILGHASFEKVLFFL